MDIRFRYLKAIKAVLIIAVISLSGLCQSAFSQVADVPTPERQAQRMSDVMAQRLDLSEKQEQQVLDLNLRLAKKEKKLLNNDNLDFWDRLEKMKGITQTRAKELKGILNDEQYQKFEALNHRTRNTATSD